MNVTQVGEIHNCDCGFSWRTGKSGSHECGYGLRKQLAELKAERDALAAAHSELRESMAAIHNTIRLDGVNTSLGALLSASKRAHEASVPTDAYLNSVRAEGVEIVKSHPAVTLCNLTHVCEEIANQLRAGKDGE
ncbi:UNVERIFIED_ORG: hypothetical protein C7429_102595 [Pantoea allii]